MRYIVYVCMYVLYNDDYVVDLCFYVALFLECNYYVYEIIMWDQTMIVGKRKGKNKGFHRFNEVHLLSMMKWQDLLMIQWKL